MSLRLLLLFFLVGAASCSKHADKSTDGDAPTTPAANPSVVVTAAEAEAGERLVAKLMAAMGGREAIGAIRTLSLDGTMIRSQPGGETAAKVRTLVKFPNMYRQEVTLSAGRVTTLLGPSGGWIVTGREAPLPLPTERRLEIENIILRNPVALLKTRQSPLFGAAARRSDKTDPEILVITVGTKETRIVLNSLGLIESMSYEIPGQGPGGGTPLTVSYADYRTTGGIQYPFSSSAVSDGTPMYRVTLKSVEANAPLPGTLFEPTSVGRGR